jgi:FMN reductase
VFPLSKTLFSMPKILLVSGSPAERARSNSLLAYAAQKLEASGFEVKTVGLRDFPADDLVLAKYDSPSFSAWKKDVEEASALIIATPVYKASLTGGLKALLDVLPQSAFRNKTLLPIATGGTAGHLLAIDFAIKPILSTLGASDIHQGVFVVDSQFRWLEGGGFELDADVQERLNSAFNRLEAQVNERAFAS